MKAQTIKATCPHCSKQFSLTEALVNEIETLVTLVEF